LTPGSEIRSYGIARVDSISSRTRLVATSRWRLVEFAREAALRIAAVARMPTSRMKVAATTSMRVKPRSPARSGKIDGITFCVRRGVPCA
jgi:hypothetical protein